MKDTRKDFTIMNPKDKETNGQREERYRKEEEHGLSDRLQAARRSGGLVSEDDVRRDVAWEIENENEDDKQ